MNGLGVTTIFGAVQPSAVQELQCLQNDPHELTLRGESYLNQGEFGKAVVDFDAFLQANPNSIDIIFKRAIAHYNNAALPESIADCSRVLERKGDEFNVLMFRGRALLVLNKLAEALNDFNRCRILRPSDPGARDFYNGTFEVIAWKEGKETKHRYEPTRYMWDKEEENTVTGNQQRKIEDQLEVLHKKAVINSDFLQETYSIDLKEALFDFTLSYVNLKVFQNPSSETTFKEGCDLLRNDKATDASNNFKLYVLSEPNDADGWYLLGISHLLCRQYYQALHSLSLSLKLKPNYQLAHLYNGIAYTRLIRFAERSQYKIFAKKASESYNTAKKLEEVNKNIREITQGVAVFSPEYLFAFKCAYSEYIENRKNAAFNGVKLLKANRFIEAADQFVLHLSSTPSDSEGWYLHGLACLHSKLYLTATLALTQCLELHPVNVLALNCRAFVFERLGKYDKAHDDFTKSIQVQKDTEELFNLYQSAKCEKKLQFLPRGARALENFPQRKVVHFCDTVKRRTFVQCIKTEENSSADLTRESIVEDTIKLSDEISSLNRNNDKSAESREAKPASTFVSTQDPEPTQSLATPENRKRKSILR